MAGGARGGVLGGGVALADISRTNIRVSFGEGPDQDAGSERGEGRGGRRKDARAKARPASAGARFYGHERVRPNHSPAHEEEE